MTQGQVFETPVVANAGAQFPLADARTIYCSPTGTGTGATSGSRCSVATALATMAAQKALVLEGSWVMDLAAGTYAAFSLPTGLFTRDYLVIQGPDVGGHPNVPTAIIDAAVSGGTTKGIIVASYQRCWIKDIKTKNFSVSGVDASGHCVVRFWNHHDDGSDSGRRVYNQTRHFHAGGLLTNNPTFGVQELFNCTRDTKGETQTYAQGLVGHSLDLDTDAATLTSYGTKITGLGSGGGGTEYGWFAKECCTGHLDYVTITDCDSGINFQSWVTANVKYLTIKRCNVGVVTLNSEVHQESFITWGAGVDACTGKFNMTGMSARSDMFGWTNASTIRLGRRPLLPINQDYVTVTNAADTTEQVIRSWTVPAGIFVLQGQQFKADFWGQFGDVSAGAGLIRFRWYLAGTLIVQHAFASPGDSRLNNLSFFGELTILASQDGAHQRACSRLLVDSLPAMVDSAQPALDLSIDQTLELRAQVADSTQVVNHRLIEVFG